jgi:hypothetical protein
MSQKIGVVTGSSSSMGFETSLILARIGFHTYATAQCSYYISTICEVGDDKFGSHFAQYLRSFVEAVYKRSDLKIALSKKFDDTSSYGTNISGGSSNKDGCVV